MSSLSFNLSSVTGDQAEATITLVALSDGQIQVTVDLQSGTIGDLQGIFFDIKDESLVDGLSVTGDEVTSSNFVVNGVTDLGNGVNLKGTKTKFDGGVQLGSSGIGDDDISSATFLISHDTLDLSIDQFIDQTFGIRLTSVGDDREGSSKLLGSSSHISVLGEHFADDGIAFDLNTFEGQDCPEGNSSYNPQKGGIGRMSPLGSDQDTFPTGQISKNTITGGFMNDSLLGQRGRNTLEHFEGKDSRKLNNFNDSTENNHILLGNESIDIYGNEGKNNCDFIHSFDGFQDIIQNQESMSGGTQQTELVLDLSTTNSEFLSVSTQPDSFGDSYTF